MSHTIEGRVWKFGDNINTDLIFPNTAFRLPEAEQHRLTFSSNRPGWVDQVMPGDLIVGGENFGMGSGRPSGLMLKRCGVAGLVAESLNGLCFRNCVSAGFAATQCSGVTALFEEGDIGRLDFATGLITNVTRNRSLQGQALDKLLLDIIGGGGVLPVLTREGYIEAQSFIA